MARFRNGLSVLERGSGGDLTLISFHSPHSLTWSWFVSFTRFKADEWRVRPLWFGYRHNCGWQCGVRLPFWGFLSLHRQHPMWYRNLMNGQRDRHEGEKRDAYQRGREQGRRDVFQGVGRD